MQLAGGQRGLMLRCLTGTLWLTTGNGMDYLIYEGRSFNLGAGVTALIEALGSAEMRLETASCEGTSMWPIAAALASRPGTVPLYDQKAKSC
jgi:hypothetical protein